MTPLTHIPRSIKPAGTAYLFGVGNTGDYFKLPGAKNGIELRLDSPGASGDARGIYVQLKLSGIGGGEAGRFWAKASNAATATASTINGVHTSMNIDASCGVSGAGNALRATLGAAAAVRTLGGTLAAIQADSDIGTGNTLPAGSHSFIRFTNSGAVALGNLFQIPAPASASIFSTHTTQIMTHSIKIIDSAGTPYYIMCTNGAGNRG